MSLPVDEENYLRQLRRDFVTRELQRYKIATWAVFCIALVTLVFVVILAFGGTTEQPTWQLIVLLGFATLIAAMPLLRKVNLSKDGGGFEISNPLELINEMEARAAAARSEAMRHTQAQIGALSMQFAELMSRLDGPSSEASIQSNPDEPTLAQIKKSLPPPKIKDDPQKNRFGSLNQDQRCILTATISDSAFGKSWQKIVFRLSTKDRSPLLGTDVYFFLHDSFDPDIYRVKVGKDVNYVELETASVGAFTVGVVAEQNHTLLELDLSGPEIMAPQWWKNI